MFKNFISNFGWK